VVETWLRGFGDAPGMGLRIPASAEGGDMRCVGCRIMPVRASSSPSSEA
jgi:hypothetical protein